MLNYKTTGPDARGRFYATYQTPGCDIPTVACDCSTREQADSEASRLNAEQITRERAIQRERELCGLHRIHNDVRI